MSGLNKRFRKEEVPTYWIDAGEKENCYFEKIY